MKPDEKISDQPIDKKIAMKEAILWTKALRRRRPCPGRCRGLGPPTCDQCELIREQMQEKLNTIEPGDTPLCTENS